MLITPKDIAVATIAATVAAVATVASSGVSGIVHNATSEQEPDSQNFTAIEIQQKR
jgi:hypothetical protein